jgi:hypothetical protein
MIFDFDFVETPSVMLGHVVSPLTSNRKQKGASKSKEKMKVKTCF